MATLLLFIYGFAQALRLALSVAVSKRLVSAAEAIELIEELKRHVQHDTAVEEAATSCFSDFDLVMVASKSGAQAHVLARKLDDLTMFVKFMTGTFESER